MKKGLLLSVLAMASLAMAADVAFDGQVRYRMENSNEVFDSDIDAFNHTYLRTRLGATVTPQDGLKIYIQAQDSRHVGDPMLGNSGNTVADENLGLHQGFFTWDCQVVDNLTIQAGRFEFAKADERFFAKSDWNNNGLSHEGWVLSYGTPIGTVDLFGLKSFEMEIAKQDVTNWGVYFNNLFEKRIDVFYDIYDFGQDAAENKNAVSTIGVHYDNTYFEKLGVNFNFGAQMGTNEQIAGDPAYSGMMYGLDVNYGLDLPILNKVGFGYESKSGQDTSGDITAWMELYPSTHKFWGYQDIPFTGVNGLTDLQLNFAGALPMDMGWKLDYHIFSSAEEFTNNAEAAATDVGSEIDLSLGHKMNNFGVNLGWSMFTPADNFGPAAGADSQSWMYLMFTAGF